MGLAKSVGSPGDPITSGGTVSTEITSSSTIQSISTITGGASTVQLMAIGSSGTIQPIALTGVDQDSVKFISVETIDLLRDILSEIKIQNQYLSIIVGDKIKENEVD